MKTATLLIALLLAGTARADAAADLEEAHREAALDALRASPKVIRVVISAELCRERQARATTMAEIAAEKKYSRIGGVVRLRRMASLQEELREEDARIQIELDRLREQKLAALACSEMLVRAVLKCDDEGEKGEPAGECAIPRMVDVRELLGYEHEYALADQR